MPRTSKVSLNKTTQSKLKRLSKQLEKNPIVPNVEDFISYLESILKAEIKALKGCSERMIVDYYFNEINKELDNCELVDEEFFNNVKARARSKLASHYTDDKSFDNNIDIYFNEVKREYIKSPMSDSDNLEFLPENRDTFIKNNLKLVINCAKRYRNLGLPFEDLIQIGNYGLCIAFEKYDKDRANLKVEIIKNINSSPLDSFTYKDAEEIIKHSFSYSKNLEQTISSLPEEGFMSKEEFINWTNKNIKTAIFASVAFQWIRAYILHELNKLSKIIHVPKSARKKVDEDGNEVNQSLTIINLDSINPYTDDNYHDNELSEITQEEFAIEDEYMENLERHDLFKDIVDKALYNLPLLDRRIVKKRFGIGLPYQLSINEIAESEGMVPNKVKYSITQSLKVINNSLNEKEKQLIVDLLR